jgi:hypothetical protein
MAQTQFSNIIGRLMHEADGAPATMANGANGPDTYRSFAQLAVEAMETLARQDGHHVLATELAAITEGYGAMPGRRPDQLQPGETVAQLTDRLTRANAG